MTGLVSVRTPLPIKLRTEGSSLRLSTPRIAISAVALGAAAATTGVAFAAVGPAKSTPVVNRAAAQPAPATEAPVAQSVNGSEKAIRDYWTPARIKSAKSVDGPAPTANTNSVTTAAVPSGPEVSSPPGAPQAGASATGDVSAASRQARVWTRHGKAPALTTGKMFYSRGRYNYTCSASVLWTRNRSTVWTAGHCVFGRGEGWARNLVFRPDFVNGRSKGVWVARRMWTTAQWKNRGNPGFDVGAFVVRRKRGHGIAYYTGGQGTRFNIRGFRHAIRSFGYPGETNKGRPMNSNLLWWCSDTTFGFKFSGLNAVNRGMRCTMGRGSSGGPWIYKMNRRGLGYVIGNVSHGVNDGDWVSSPYFGRDALGVYNAAKNF